MAKIKEYQNEYFPQSVFHPGVDLKEKLDEIKMGPKEFALKSEKPEKTITAILKFESSITPDMAVQFEKVLKIPADFWLKRQYQYNEYIAREKQESMLQESGVWSKKFPYKEMIKLNWIPESKNLSETTGNLLSFFGIASHKAWENYFLNQKLKLAFRISLKHISQPYAVSAWLRQGEIQASKLDTGIYSEKIFKSVLHDLKSIMIQCPDDLFNKIQKLLMKAGVKIIFTKCLPKACVNGTTRWINDKPLIQLSDRYKRYDIFWFTFFHEIGHILLHGKKDIFIEFGKENDEKEKEADNFAVKWLLPLEQENEIFKSGNFSEQNIIKFAKKFDTHPSIIIGRLQHRGYINFGDGYSLIQPVHFE